MNVMYVALRPQFHFAFFTTGFGKFIEIDLHRSISNANGNYSTYYTLYFDGIATFASSFGYLFRILSILSILSPLIHATCARNTAAFFLIIIFFICCLRNNIVSAFMAMRYHFSFTWMATQCERQSVCVCVLSIGISTHIHWIEKETTNFCILWMGSVSGKRLNLSDAQFETTRFDSTLQ